MSFEDGIDISLIALLQDLRNKWISTKYIANPLNEAIELVKQMSEQHDILNIQLSAAEHGLLEYRELAGKIHDMIHGVRSDNGLGFNVD